VSIGRRIIDLARAELNSLLERASSSSSSSHEDGAPDADEDLYRRYGLSELTDAQLEAELERRRLTREAAARAARARAEYAARQAEEGARRAQENDSARTRTPGQGSAGASRPRPPVSGDEVRRAYAALEVAYGADFATVRKSYRALVRKYHPDRQGPSPDKQKAANELTQRLTAAYKVLGRHLRK
jgi:DnaJ-domain-containing protein 1